MYLSKGKSNINAHLLWGEYNLGGGWSINISKAESTLKAFDIHLECDSNSLEASFLFQ